jgi:hypothetical protein
MVMVSGAGRVPVAGAFMAKKAEEAATGEVA